MIETNNLIVIIVLATVIQILGCGFENSNVKSSDDKSQKEQIEEISNSKNLNIDSLCLKSLIDFSECEKKKESHCEKTANTFVLKNKKYILMIGLYILTLTQYVGNSDAVAGENESWIWKKIDGEWTWFANLDTWKEYEDPYSADVVMFSDNELVEWMPLPNERSYPMNRVKIRSWTGDEKQISDLNEKIVYPRTSFKTTICGAIDDEEVVALIEDSNGVGTLQFYDNKWTLFKISATSPAPAYKIVIKKTKTDYQAKIQINDGDYYDKELVCNILSKWNTEGSGTIMHFPLNEDWWKNGTENLPTLPYIRVPRGEEFDALLP